jgi:Response regulators consisting of a CheY-like receiver domain and a winged-helix DNA-binding domain
MKRILFVEDDDVVARIYSGKLSVAGFEVTRAPDGLEALKLLGHSAPDLVVLDILMPKMSGVEVLQHIRSDPRLKSTKVIVFSNAFLGDTAGKLAALGVDAMLLKASVTPQQLIDSIHTSLNRSESSSKTSGPLSETPPDSNPTRQAMESAAEFSRRIRRDFFEQIPAISQNLKQSWAEFLGAGGDADRMQKLEAFSRKINFLTHMTGMAGCYRIAQLSSALEALLFEMQEKSSNVNESSRHTVQATVELLVAGLGRADQADEQCLSPTTILIVDDDIVSNRALSFALERYKLKPVSVPEPLAALDLLRRNSYDAVLLDINLPTMDGITLCKRMRELPTQRHTPVVFFTSYMEFEPRARAILRNGDELIAKPVLPIELTVKVISLSFKRRIPFSA